MHHVTCLFWLWQKNHSFLFLCIYSLWVKWQYPTCGPTAIPSSLTHSVILWFTVVDLFKRNKLIILLLDKKIKSISFSIHEPGVHGWALRAHDKTSSMLNCIITLLSLGDAHGAVSGMWSCLLKPETLLMWIHLCKMNLIFGGLFLRFFPEVH